MVTMLPFNSNTLSKAGIAVISLDFLSTLTCPQTNL